MKKLTFCKSLFLLCALIVGSSSAWADDSTLTPSSSAIAPSDDYIQVTYGGSGSNPAWQSSGVLRLYAKNTITFASKNQEKITGISFTAKVNANSKGTYPTGITANVGTISASATFSSTGNKDITWSYTTGAESVTLTIGGTAGNIEVSSYTVTYSASASKEDPTITFNNGSVRVGKTLDLSTLFTSNSTGAVTYSITAGDSYASLESSTLTGVAEGSVTVKAEQAAAGNYNAGEATATITVNPALVLSSIAVTTPPTKTTYIEGESFDPTGMVVTATYADESTDDVTDVCTFTPSGALTTSDTEITVRYTENATTKTTTQAITVNEYVQPTTINATFNNVFLGVAAGTRITEKTTITQDNVDFVFDKISGSNWPQGDANLIRIYKGTTLQFKAPSGYVLTNITFTANGDWKDDMTADKGTYDDEKDSDNKTYWTGAVNDVTFSPGGTHRISTVEVVIAKLATITLNAACNDGEGNIYGTYSNESAFVVPSNLTVSAVKVDGNGKLVVTPYETGDIVKANTGVMVSSTTAGDHTLILTESEGTEISGNMLKGTGNGIDADAMATAAPSCTYYRLTMHNPATDNKIGFWWGAANGAAFDIAANKAYLAVPTGASAKEGFTFEDTTTGINGVEEIAPVTKTRKVVKNGRLVIETPNGEFTIDGARVK